MCAECGLAFVWAHVFNPLLQPPRWCVEYARWWAVPWRLMTTLAMSLVPWRFWLSLGMHHQPQWFRIGVQVLCCAILFIGAACAYEVGEAAHRQWRWHDAQLRRYTQQFVQRSPQGWQRLNAQGHFLQNYVISEPVGPAQAVACTLFMPWSAAHCGHYVFQDGTTRPCMVIPRDVVAERFEHLDFWLRWNRRAIARTMLFPVGMALLIPAAFILLPATRRASRVRWRHIVRIALYGMLWPSLAAAWWVHLVPHHIAGGYRWDEMALTAFVLVPAALTIWWGFAISRHLQMRSPWLTTLSLAAIAYLLLMSLGYFSLILSEQPSWLA